MKKYTVWQTLLYKSPTGFEKYKVLSQNAIVETDGEEENDRMLVTDGRVAGWVAVSRLADYIEALPKDLVNLAELQTPEKNDAEQNLNWESERIVNACGEIGVAYILEKPLKEVFEVWKQKQPRHYAFVDSQRWLTGENDLAIILECFGIESETLRLPMLTPHALDEVMQKNNIIIGVWIDRYTGRLATTGIRHWVVPVIQFIDRFGYGTIDIYNSFPNRLERYSWTEFSKAVGNVGGVKVMKI